MRFLTRAFFAIVVVCAVLASGPGVLWLLGAESTWLSWLPTDLLTSGIQDEFWRHMALGLVNGVVLAFVALASIITWQKRSDAA